jgi:hypothetical protein
MFLMAIVQGTRSRSRDRANPCSLASPRQSPDCRAAGRANSNALRCVYVSFVANVTSSRPSVGAVPNYGPVSDGSRAGYRSPKQ